MKFDKFTRILINLVLILFIALLLKSLFTVPRNLYAQGNFEYKVVIYEDEIEKAAREEGATTEKERCFKFEAPLNLYANEGWRLHSHIKLPRFNYTFLIFER